VCSTSNQSPGVNRGEYARGTIDPIAPIVQLAACRSYRIGGVAPRSADQETPDVSESRDGTEIALLM
jgi:hypothetical protein